MKRLIKTFLAAEFCLVFIVVILNAMLFALHRLYGVDVQNAAVGTTFILGGMGQALVLGCVATTADKIFEEREENNYE